MARGTHLKDVGPNPFGYILAGIGAVAGGVGVAYGSTEIIAIGGSLLILGVLIQVYIKSRGRRT